MSEANINVSTPAYIGTDAVTGAQLAGNSVNTIHLVLGAVVETRLASNCVAESKIKTGAVTSTKIANNAVQAIHLDTNIPISTFNDVTITSATTGQTLNYNGSQWVNTSDLEVNTNSVDFGLPAQLKNMTTTERDALTPAAGWVIFNTTTSKMEVYDGTTWQAAW